MFLKHIVKLVLIVLVLAAHGCSTVSSEGPYQTTGIKIGEVTDKEAIVWTRLTRHPERVGLGAPMPEILYEDSDTGKLVKKPKGRPDSAPVVKFPENSTIQTIEGAVPGADGKIRLQYKVEDSSNWKTTNWNNVDPKRDYTHQFKLTNLKPSARYQVRVEATAGAGTKGQLVNGSFKTAPHANTPERVVFTVSTGQAYPDQDAAGGGYKIYDAMLKLDPSFFVHTGDILYYDKLAKTVPLARWHWARMYSLPTNVEFHRQVTSYFIKDDHDTWMNDCWPSRKTKFMGDFTFEQGLGIFLEQVPMGNQTYRTFRWGRDLQIWLVEGRDFRSPNTMPDGPDGLSGLFRNRMQRFVFCAARHLLLGPIEPTSMTTIRT
jgi:alkaline phosphatase D